MTAPASHKAMAPAFAVGQLQLAGLALLRDELLALGQMLPCHAQADTQAACREARHATAIEDAFDDVPV